jgi:hypothetical protein
MRRVLLTLWFALWLVPLRTEATPLVMEPGTIRVERFEGSVLLWELDWSLVSAETDGTTTLLVLSFDYAQYQGEGGGTVTFDVPVLSPDPPSYHGRGLWFFEAPDDAFHWEYFGNCCVSTPGVVSDSLQTQISVELAGVPTTVEFAPGQSAAFTTVPEPSPALAVAAGMLALAWIRRRDAQR